MKHALRHLVTLATAFCAPLPIASAGSLLPDGIPPTPELPPISLPPLDPFDWCDGDRVSLPVVYVLGYEETGETTGLALTDRAGNRGLFIEDGVNWQADDEEFWYVVYGWAPSAACHVGEGAPGGIDLDVLVDCVSALLDPSQDVSTPDQFLACAFSAESPQSPEG